MPLPSIELVRWHDLEDDARSDIRQLDLDERQIEYAGTTDVAIAICERDSAGDVAGLALRSGAQWVGFLLLKRRSKAPEWAVPGAATITAMRVHRLRQGQGIGTAALLALPAWLAANWPESSSLALSVDEENVAAIRVYAKAGFVDRGLRAPGRIGWVRYMTRPIQLARER